MKLSDFARGVPEEVWQWFEPILPRTVWAGVGRKPYDDRAVLHALLYVLITGIPWSMLPPGMPSGKTVRRRLQRWQQQQAFLTAWTRLAQRYEQTHGLNWDRLLIDGTRKPAKKGAKPPAATPPIAASAAVAST